ncbi:sigma-70 family RNA polymerase sigma factor [Undibacterium sp. TJN25]|uniref:sigma-70 family RNA polymerase sigma factor n=1 Tax=Undibacterium sp. TJN25 TaxID=3413056 RepID=UPI003BF3EADD
MPEMRSQEALVNAVAEHRPFLLRIARLQLYSQAEAEDVVQEALIAAISGWQSFAAKSSLRSWLTGILRYKIIDQIQSRRLDMQRHAELYPAEEEQVFDGFFTEDGSWDPETFVSNACPAAAVEQTQLMDIVELCMNNLPEASARLFLMREYLGMELADIVEVSAVTPGGLRVLLYRARMRLRDCVVRGWGEY